jgi:copper transport protein
MTCNTSLKIILIIFAVSSILVISSIPNSYEHAWISSSTPNALESLPSSPSEVDVIFSDPVDITYSHIQVIDSNGNQVQNNDLHYTNSDRTGLGVSLKPGIPNGVYTVSTKVLDQTDGHVTKPGFVFGVNTKVTQTSQPSSNIANEISVPDAIARFPTLVGQVIVVGVAAATLWLWGPTTNVRWLHESISESRKLIDKKMARWALIGSILLIVSDFGMMIAEANAIGSGLDSAFATKFGSTVILRLIMSVALLGISAISYLKTRDGNKMPLSFVWALFIIGIGTLLTTSLIGHGTAVGGWYATLLDFVHNVVASLWIGGVFYLAFVAFPVIKQLKNSRTFLSVTSLLIPRFSILTVSLLGVIAITGPFLLYLLENDLSLTLASTYGKILIVKLLLAAAMISTGAYTQLVTHKRISKLLSATVESNSTSQSQISLLESKSHGIIKFEAILGIALLVSVAVLTNSGTPGNEFPNQQNVMPNVFAITPLGTTQSNVFTDYRSVDGNNVTMTITPFGLGNNNFTVTFRNSSMWQLDMKSAELVLTQTDNSLSLPKINMQKTGMGTFSTNIPFGIGGNWEVAVNGFQNQINSTEIATMFSFYLKPNLNQLSLDIKEYPLPENDSSPLYPVYDKSRDTIWVGDSKISSGRIFGFDLASKQFKEHRINGTNIVTWMVLDSKNNIWYVDPLNKILGDYDPRDNSDKQYRIPIQTHDIVSGLAIDKMNNLWLIVANTDNILRFDPQSESFATLSLPQGAEPLGITVAQDSGLVWIAESGSGQIAEVNPTNNVIVQHDPKINATQADLTSIIEDPNNGVVYVTEHEGHGLLVFDTLINLFKQYPLDQNQANLPFGMTIDNNGYLWIAQHTYDKAAVLDPNNGQYVQIDIPSKNSFTQWLVFTDKGVAIAEQRSHSLGLITESVSNAVTSNVSNSVVVSNYGLSYAGFVTPFIAVFVVISSFFYTKTKSDLDNSIKSVQKLSSDDTSVRSAIVPKDILYEEKK